MEQKSLKPSYKNKLLIMMFRVGDLVRWVADWHIYAADSLGDVHGEKPIYATGIVVENRNDMILVVYSFSENRRYLINRDFLDCEILNHCTPQETKCQQK